MSNAAGSSLHFNADCEALGVWSTDLHFQRRVTQEISDLSALTTDALTDINDSYQIYFHSRRSADSNPTIPNDSCTKYTRSLAYRAVVQIIHPSATLAPPLHSQLQGFMEAITVIGRRQVAPSGLSQGHRKTKVPFCEPATFSLWATDNALQIIFVKMVQEVEIEFLCSSSQKVSTPPSLSLYTNILKPVVALRNASFIFIYLT